MVNKTYNQTHFIFSTKHDMREMNPSWRCGVGSVVDGMMALD
jgi:hypothetical protein